MVRKGKQQGPGDASRPIGPPPLPQKDLFHRVNFAYQASIFLQNLNVEAGPSTSCSPLPTSDHAVKDIAQQSLGKSITKAAGQKRRGDADFGKLAKGEMTLTRRMATHNQLKWSAASVKFHLSDRKLTLFRDPSLKRTICRKCCTVLIPGLTSKVRLRRELLSCLL